jgi:hypothetical protein
VDDAGDLMLEAAGGADTLLAATSFVLSDEIEALVMAARIRRMAPPRRMC